MITPVYLDSKAFITYTMGQDNLSDIFERENRQEWNGARNGAERVPQASTLRSRFLCLVLLAGWLGRVKPLSTSQEDMGLATKSYPITFTRTRIL